MNMHDEYLRNMAMLLAMFAAAYLFIVVFDWYEARRARRRETSAAQPRWGTDDGRIRLGKIVSATIVLADTGPPTFREIHLPPGDLTITYVPDGLPPSVAVQEAGPGSWKTDDITGEVLCTCGKPETKHPPEEHAPPRTAFDEIARKPACGGKRCYVRQVSEDGDGVTMHASECVQPVCYEGCGCGCAQS